MLAAPNRLKRPREISRVFGLGRFGGAEVLMVKALPNHTELSRAVIVVSKKVSKRAVVRNKIRRRVSGVLETNWATVRPGYDIVISIREDISDMPASEIKTAVLKALDKAGTKV